MKLGPVTKLDKSNTVTSKKMILTSRRQIVTSLYFFPIYGHFEAIQKWDSGLAVYKTYIFINSNILSNKTWKQN